MFKWFRTRSKKHTTIPNELLIAIILWCNDSPETLGTLSQTCHRFYRLIRDNLTEIKKRNSPQPKRNLLQFGFNYPYSKESALNLQFDKAVNESPLNYKYLSLLLACGGDIDFARHKKRTALMFSIGTEDLKRIQFFIQNGANPIVKDSQTETIIEWAASHRGDGLMYLLQHIQANQKDLFADIHMPRKQGLHGDKKLNSEYPIVFDLTDFINWYSMGWRQSAIYWTFGGKYKTLSCNLKNAKLLLEYGADPFLFGPHNEQDEPYLQPGLLDLCADLTVTHNSSAYLADICKVFLEANDNFQRKPGQLKWTDYYSENSEMVLPAITRNDRIVNLSSGIKKSHKNGNMLVFELFKERMLSQYGQEELSKVIQAIGEGQELSG
ncbi:hypothetical protein HK100_007264 [Physocladia obscura]|uniref:F-box domain-containing protein n=1 Tax=Physocladia obscura TaxID=109957 RepID=A0AAD5SPK5_9FUNG|nr:hypothetical protein HK100_007264 [Physocladia obscura]